MPNVNLFSGLILAVALGLLSGSPGLTLQASAMNIVETRNFRETVLACEHGFDPPKVHHLPLGAGKEPVASCFNNGFQTIYPHTKNIGACYIALKPERTWEQWEHRERKVVRVIRREYHCRFLGAGAILGQSTGVWKTGIKVYFRGEEPTNFKTKDPGCETIFDELSRENENYDYLIRR